MLSLMSSVSDRLTGTRSFVNCVIGCGDAVFFDDEVLLLEGGDQPPFGIAHGDGGGHQLRGGLEIVLVAQIDRPLPFDSHPTAVRRQRLLAQDEPQQARAETSEVTSQNCRARFACG